MQTNFISACLDKIYNLQHNFVYEDGFEKGVLYTVEYRGS